MILSKNDIIHHNTKSCIVQPFKNNNVQPASYDLTLGNQFMSYIDPYDADENCEYVSQVVIDPFINDKLKEFIEVEDGATWSIEPGEFLLAVTEETINMPLDLVGRIEGKSSLGRLGLAVHITAGYIDPGFCGKITLELFNFNKFPIKLYPGMPIAQLSLHTLFSKVSQGYKGKYQNADTLQESRYWKNKL